jgi:metal-responsive CopG/Arc/MetJ family transcriptional regulator
MKTAISLPEPLLKAADTLASRLGLSRSEVFQRAMERLLDAYDEQVTDALNQVYAAEPPALDPALARMQAASLPAEQR